MSKIIEHQGRIDQLLTNLVDGQALQNGQCQYRAELEDKICAHFKYYGDDKTSEQLPSVLEFMSIKGLESALEFLINEGDDLTWDHETKEWRE